ncbi:MAG: hypothetical protein ACFB4I_11125 [Cyanophyceae cyanobacterium]
MNKSQSKVWKWRILVNEIFSLQFNSSPMLAIIFDDSSIGLWRYVLSAPAERSPHLSQSVAVVLLQPLF